MVELKYALLLFFWPVGAADEPPLWTSKYYEDYAECVADAPVVAERVRAEYGKDIKIQYQCFAHDNEVKL